MSRVRLFADDCLIHREIHNPEDRLALQKDLDILEQWVNKWGMQFTFTQANVTFCQYPDPLLCTDFTCYMVLYSRINRSEDLQWENHICSIAAKSSSTLGLLKRNLLKYPYSVSYCTVYTSVLPFIVRTVPEWNSVPEACVNADTITAFQAQLRHAP